MFCFRNENNKIIVVFGFVFFNEKQNIKFYNKLFGEAFESARGGGQFVF